MYIYAACTLYRKNEYKCIYVKNNARRILTEIVLNILLKYLVRASNFTSDLVFQEQNVR